MDYPDTEVAQSVDTPLWAFVNTTKEGLFAVREAKECEFTAISRCAPTNPLHSGKRGDQRTLDNDTDPCPGDHGHRCP